MLWTAGYPSGREPAPRSRRRRACPRRSDSSHLVTPGTTPGGFGSSRTGPPGKGAVPRTETFPMTQTVNTQPRAAARLHAGFLALLPRIETHARIFFRGVKCPGKRDDLIAEAIA